MRLIRLKVKPLIETLLKPIARELCRGDLDYVLDLYALLRFKGNCIPTDSLLKKIASAYAKALDTSLIITSALLKKRKVVLNELIKSAFFALFLKRKAADPSLNAVEEVENWCIVLASLNRKIQKAECLTCSLLSDCAFGKKYGNDVTNIKEVIDEDYNTLVHKDCPSRPDIDSANQAYKSLQALKALNANTANVAAGSAGVDPTELASLTEIQAEAEKQEYFMMSDEDTFDDLNLQNIEDEEDVPWLESVPIVSGNSPFTATLGGSRFINLNPKTIDKLSVSQLAIFKLSKKLDVMVAKAAKGKFKPTDELSKNKKSVNIESASDLAKVHSAEHALSDDVFTAKLAKHDLKKKSDVKRTEKKPLLYVSLDVSYSMFTLVGSTFLGYMTRASLAQCFSMSLCRRIKDDGGILFVRPFDGSTGMLRSARKKEDFDVLETYLSMLSFDGSDTDIYGAFNDAFSDIGSAKNELAKAEILMITDGQCSMTLSQVASLKKNSENIVVSILDLNTEDTNLMSNHKREITLRNIQNLKEISDHYFRFDVKANALDKMVSLVSSNITKKKKD